jgi:hypothetical protein
MEIQMSDTHLWHSRHVFTHCQPVGSTDLMVEHRYVAIYVQTMPEHRDVTRSIYRYISVATTTRSESARV